MYTQRYRQRDRQRHTETERQNQRPMHMHRNMLTDGERQASMQDCKQSVSQAGSHACLAACIHTERARCPQTYADRDIPRDTYRDRGT